MYLCAAPNLSLFRLYLTVYITKVCYDYIEHTFYNKIYLDCPLE